MSKTNDRRKTYRVSREELEAYCVGKEIESISAGESYHIVFTDGSEARVSQDSDNGFSFLNWTVLC